jgi:SHS2 domain-containing protein
MTYSFHEHTADVRMDVESKSFPGLLHQALLGLFDLLRPRARARRVQRRIEVRAKDATSLFIDFLSDVLSLAQANGEAYSSVRFTMLRPTLLRATLFGRKIASFDEDIKGVTYHEADVTGSARGIWHGHVVFDI